MKIPLSKSNSNVLAEHNYFKIRRLDINTLQGEAVIITGNSHVLAEHNYFKQLDANILPEEVVVITDDLLTVEEALSSPQTDKWKRVLDEEYDWLVKNKIWNLCTVLLKKWIRWTTLTFRL